ncbi:DUF1684 domain-containing protein [Mongoliitalea lutea]|uniref:DUF1684 domain-containing protein n=1 Tax=Mongoliitalea lutea TaxID=849756 RepID=A0A8J3CUD1_9BACT|nr:DUF1684 domain-containing protein [Mongoliitalea lutea]GHB25207.1 hypothetical protein GCM10008106_02450 [Mongoliitalea lutea]
MKKKLLPILICLLYFFSCDKKPNKLLNQKEHEELIDSWVENRLASLKKDDGWLNLIGLHWISNSETSMGSADYNDILLPADKFPEKIGTFFWQDSILTFTPKIDGITYNGQMVESPMILYTSGLDEPTKTLSLGSLLWTIIIRGDALGVRIRDLDASAISDFKGIPRFATSLDWRLKGEFTPYEFGKELSITNVLGQTSINLSPGFVSFEKDGKVYQLDALDANNQLYLIFADASSGLETYGGGRYLYIDKPAPKKTEVIIDFNKAYNPPCVFTAYATCPLPPRENILDLYISAGEKYMDK